MNQCYEKNKIELGIDEAGRGCLIGPVCISGVIMDDIEKNPPPYKIRDSKKCSPKIRKILREYIETNSIAFSVQLIDEKIIDTINILKATMKGMHLCVDDIIQQISIDTILVDGNQFDPYLDENFEPIDHICIPKGDDKYLNIAAASILAKEYHDEYIEKLVNENPELNNYKLLNNKGYGTKDHINAIKEYGHTNWHRKSFKI
jgi:ribonuclease HII